MNKAFTLSEVLITLGIIGVVASMTLPAIIQKFQEEQLVTGFKKTYSSLENAYMLVINEHGNYNSWSRLAPEYERDEQGNIIKDQHGNAHDITRYLNAENIFQKFKPYIKILKECKSNESGCFPDKISYYFKKGESNLVNAQFGIRKFAVLADGTSIGFLSSGAIYFDVNGLKKPNVVGKDIFQVQLGEKGIETYDNRQGDVKCYTNEWTCSTWVLANDNLDYLHCNDLSWKGKNKCK